MRAIFGVSILLMAISCGTSGHPPVGVAPKGDCVDPPPGLVAWWPMDEAPGANQVADAMGAHNGVPTTGQVVPVTPLPQFPFVSAIDSGGNNVYSLQPKVTSSTHGALMFWNAFLRVPHDPALNVGAKGLTIDAWIFPNHLSQNPPFVLEPLVDKFDPAQNTGYSLYLRQTGFSGGAVWQLELNLNGTTFASTSTFLVPCCPWGSKNWYFVAVTITPASGGNPGTVRFFIDGSPAGTFSHPFTASQLANTVDLWIAGNRTLNIQPVEIALDEVEIFNRALTEEELQDIYAADRAGKCKPADLSVKKTLSPPSPWQVDQTGQFVIQVTNNGPSPVPSGTVITVTDTIPVGLTYMGYAGNGWTCAPPPPAPPIPGPVTVTCQYTAGLGVGQSTPPLTLNVTPTKADSFKNCAEVDAASLWDTDPTNDQSCVSFQVVLIKP